MNFRAPDRSPQPRTEQIILFRISGQPFAISSAAVQEVRSVDNIAGMARDLPESHLRKVRHSIRRGDRVIGRLRENAFVLGVLSRRTAQRAVIQDLVPPFQERAIPTEELAWLARIVWLSQ